MKFGYVGMAACLLFGCGRSTAGQVTAVTRGGGAAAASTEADESFGDAAEQGDPASRLLEELAQLPHLDVSKSARVAPNCQTPTSVGLSDGASGTRAARLLWDQETGDCVLEDIDGSSDGMLGILTLRQQEERVVVSSVGKWRFYSPPELDLADVPPNQPFTIYPYLGEWQFVATLEHNTQLVKLLEFAYLRGEGQANGGAREDLKDQAPSDFVPPTLCAPKPDEGEAP